MKIKEIRELDLEELAGRESHLKGELFNLRIQNSSGQLENVKRIWAVKKEIARVKTIMREKQLNGSGQKA